MLVATLKDLKKNINYNIYVNAFNNKIDFYVKAHDYEKYYYLNKDKIKKLFKNIFNNDQTYSTNQNGYNVFLDEANNKHFYKNNIENIELFFKNNGVNALMFEEENTEEKEDIKELSKSFYIKNASKNILMILTCSIIGLNSIFLVFYTSDYITSNLTFNEYISKKASSTYNYFNTLETKEIIKNINDSDGLTEKEKEILINENLFNDILNVADRNRNHELREKTINIKKVYFTEEETRKLTNIVGFYNPLQPNIIHIKNQEQDKTTNLTHEFIHLLQDDNQYYFIREAVAEIVKEEYYKEENKVYLEEVKYTKILMEIIGPEPVFECCFKGNTMTFEESIRRRLNEEDTIELLNLFRSTPSDIKNKEKIYSKITDLLNKMKTGDIKKDYIINAILNNSETIKKGYFNKEYIEEKKQEYNSLYLKR